MTPKVSATRRCLNASTVAESIGGGGLAKESPVRHAIDMVHRVRVKFPDAGNDWLIEITDETDRKPLVVLPWFDGHGLRFRKGSVRFWHKADERASPLDVRY